MKNKLIIIFLSIVFLYSCDSSFRIEKRRYMKGFYVSTGNGNKKEQDKNTQPRKQSDSLPVLAKIDPVDEPLSDELLAINNNVSSQKKVAKPLYLPKNKKEIVAKSSRLSQRNLVNDRASFSMKKKKWNGSLFLFLFSGLFASSFWWFTTYRYKKAHSIRKWAFRNKLKSLSSIVAIKIFSVISSFWLGVKLFEMNVVMSEYTTHSLIGVLTVSLGVNLFRKRSIKDMFSVFRNKFNALLLSVMGILLCITLGNKAVNKNVQATPEKSYLNTISSKYLESDKQVNVSQLHLLKQSDSAGTIALKIFLILLTVVVLVVLQAFVLLWSCELSCSGAETASAMVLVFGTIATAVIGFVCFYFISKIDLNKGNEVKQ